LKVVVTDIDVKYDDPLDSLIQLLNPTPARNSSVATWTSITVRGLRRRSPTRLILVQMNGPLGILLIFE